MHTLRSQLAQSVLLVCTEKLAYKGQGFCLDWLAKACWSSLLQSSHRTRDCRTLTQLVLMLVGGSWLAQAECGHQKSGWLLHSN